MPIIECITRSGEMQKIETSNEACSKVSPLRSGDRFVDDKGKAGVVKGVAPIDCPLSETDALWVVLDDDGGKASSYCNCALADNLQSLLKKIKE